MERPLEPFEPLDAAGQRRVGAKERRADVLGLDGHEVEEVAGRPVSAAAPVSATSSRCRARLRAPSRETQPIA